MNFQFPTYQLGSDPGRERQCCPVCSAACQPALNVPLLRPWRLSGVGSALAYVGSLGEEKVEMLMALFVDADCQLLSAETLAVGVEHNVALCHPVLFRRALALGSAGMTITHNHPSGCAEPSLEDIRFTRKLALMGEATSIALIDHMIVAGDKHFSFREAGLL